MIEDSSACDVSSLLSVLMVALAFLGWGNSMLCYLLQNDIEIFFTFLALLQTIMYQNIFAMFELFALAQHNKII